LKNLLLFSLEGLGVIDGDGGFFNT
jgi:hypothetical protein